MHAILLLFLILSSKLDKNQKNLRGTYPPWNLQIVRFFGNFEICQKKISSNCKIPKKSYNLKVSGGDVLLKFFWRFRFRTRNQKIPKNLQKISKKSQKISKKSPKSPKKSLKNPKKSPKSPKKSPTNLQKSPKKSPKNPKKSQKISKKSQKNLKKVDIWICMLYWIRGHIIIFQKLYTKNRLPMEICRVWSSKRFYKPCTIFSSKRVDFSP